MGQVYGIAEDKGIVQKFRCSPGAGNLKKKKGGTKKKKKKKPQEKDTISVTNSLGIFFLLIFLFFCLFVFSRAAHSAYGGSQARV